MTKLPSVMSTLGQVVPDVRLRYESLDGKHTSAWKVTVRSVNATSCKEASRAKAHHQIVRFREVGRQLADYHPSKTRRYIARTCTASLFRSMMEGHASPRLISKREEGVWVDDQTNQHHTAKRSIPSRRDSVWREAQGNKKGFASQDRLEKGPRAAIGKKRADGQKCSHVSLLLGRGPIEAAEQDCWQS
jgi:hypothetical protein